MRFCFVVILLLLFIHQGVAQDVLVFGDTEKTNERPTYETNQRDYKKKRTLVLIKGKPDKVLRGNKCFDEYQAEKNIRVAYIQKGSHGNNSAISRLIHNFGVRVRGTFRNGPFWVQRMNKRRRECKAALHDFLG